VLEKIFKIDVLFFLKKRVVFFCISMNYLLQSKNQKTIFNKKYQKLFFCFVEYLKVCKED